MGPILRYGFEKSPPIEHMTHDNVYWHSHEQTNPADTLHIVVLHVYWCGRQMEDRLQKPISPKRAHACTVKSIYFQFNSKLNVWNPMMHFQLNMDETHKIVLRMNRPTPIFVFIHSVFNPIKFTFSLGEQKPNQCICQWKSCTCINWFPFAMQNTLNSHSKWQILNPNEFDGLYAIRSIFWAW